LNCSQFTPSSSGRKILLSAYSGVKLLRVKSTWDFLIFHRTSLSAIFCRHTTQHATEVDSTSFQDRDTGTRIIHCKISYMISATTIPVVSALLSYTGVNSTTSDPTIFTPALERPSMIRSNSLDVQPPGSIVPVAGAKAIPTILVSALYRIGGSQLYQDQGRRCLHSNTHTHPR
jgi:hypothetical protein